MVVWPTRLLSPAAGVDQKQEPSLLASHLFVCPKLFRKKQKTKRKRRWFLLHHWLLFAGGVALVLFIKNESSSSASSIIPFAPRHHHEPTTTTTTTATTLTTTMLDLPMVTTSSSSSSLPLLPPPPPPPVLTLDILSIGTIHQPDLQHTQEQIFTSHPSVRTFYKITEFNDTEVTCHTHLTPTHVTHIEQYCQQTAVSSYFAQPHFNSGQQLQTKSNPIGWLCAQRRPTDGLWKVIQEYTTSGTTTIPPLPDYLVIVDDDTYVNVPLVIQTLQHQYPPYQPHVVAGCRVQMDTHPRYSSMYGGYGTFISRATLERLIHPLHCSWYDDDDEEGGGAGATTGAGAGATTGGGDGAPLLDQYTRETCDQLERDLMGEKQFFHNGMNLVDVMHAFASGSPYLQPVEQWTSSSGCLHSDHFLGYWLGYYPVSNVVNEPLYYWGYNVSEGRIAAYNGAEIHYDLPLPLWLMKRYHCRWDGSWCQPHSHICHYMTAAQMQRLHDAAATTTRTTTSTTTTLRATSSRR